MTSRNKCRQADVRVGRAVHASPGPWGLFPGAVQWIDRRGSSARVHGVAGPAFRNRNSKAPVVEIKVEYKGQEAHISANGLWGHGDGAPGPAWRVPCNRSARHRKLAHQCAGHGSRGAYHSNMAEDACVTLKLPAMHSEPAGTETGVGAPGKVSALLLLAARNMAKLRDPGAFRPFVTVELPGHADRRGGAGRAVCACGGIRGSGGALPRWKEFGAATVRVS
jgi:hypothetical protein